MTTREPHPGISVREAPFSSLLLQVVRAHAQLATHLMQAVGLMPPQEVVLLYLDDHGPCTQREIIRFMGRDPSTVTNTLQAMERAQVIRRRPAEGNRRARIVELTEKGVALVPLVRRTWAEIERLTVAGLSEAQQAQLFSALDQVRDDLRRALRERLDTDSRRRHTGDPGRP